MHSEYTHAGEKRRGSILSLLALCLFALALGFLAACDSEQQAGKETAVLDETGNLPPAPEGYGHAFARSRY
jgi:hypothetical protein